MDVLNTQSYKRNTVSKLSEADIVTGQRPSFATMLINQAGMDTSASTINRIIKANTYLQEGKNDLAEYYLGRKLTPEEINNRVTEASNIAVFDKATKIIHHPPSTSTNFDAPSQTVADVEAQTVSNTPIHQVLNKDFTVDSAIIETPTKKLNFEDKQELEEKVPKYSSADATSHATSNDAKAAILIDEFKQTGNKTTDKAKFRAELQELGYYITGKTLSVMKARAKAELESRKGATYSVEEQKGSGLVPLGTHFYDKRKLDHLDTLSLYRGKGNKCMKDIVLSPNLVSSIKNCKPHPDLDEAEQNYYDYLANKTKTQPIRKPAPSKLTIPKSEVNRMQLQILLGSINSGNDNPEQIQKVKDLVMKMSSKHQLTQQQIKKINQILELS